MSDDISYTDFNNAITNLNDKLDVISGKLDRLLNNTYHIQFHRVRQVNLPDRQENSVKYNIYMPNKLHITEITLYLSTSMALNTTPIIVIIQTILKVIQPI